MITYDYTLTTDRERVDFLASQPLDNLSPLALQRAADYILFGKTTAGISSVQRREVLRPNTRHNTFARKPTLSLQQLQEAAPEITPTSLPNTYTRPKPTLGFAFRRGPSTMAAPHCAKCPLGPQCSADPDAAQTCDAHIPGMLDLWDSIGLLERELRASRNSLRTYRLRHWLTDLRTRQYALHDAYRRPIPSTPSHTTLGTIDWESNSGHWVDCAQPRNPTLDPEREDPLYTYWTEGETEYRQNRTTRDWQTLNVLRRHKLDLKNPHHIYCLIGEYRKLVCDAYADLDGQMKWVLDALDEVAERTPLNPIHCAILNGRIAGWTNQRIADDLAATYGGDWNPNYISYMFKNHVCRRLAGTAALMERQFAAAHNPEKWKECSCCGRRLLIDHANFVRKHITKDGFSARCKACDAEKRRTRKEATNGQ